MNLKKYILIITLGIILPINAYADKTIDKQSKQQKVANAHCKDVMHSFMSTRKYLSEPMLLSANLLNAVKSKSIYYCVIQYTKDNVTYSRPINVLITYNPKTGTYKYK